MHVVVTGAAGFIGSHTAEALVAEGHRVTGIDCFTEYYDRAQKEDNVAAVRASTADVSRPDARFDLIDANLVNPGLEEIFEGVDAVLHLAGQAGVRLSWSDGFAAYSERNVQATQCVLEAAKTAGVGRVVYASSSSVYGEVDRFPVLESDLPKPFSPYGVTKLAAEHLAVLYARNWGLPTVSLRYFTVYGPRQRPDMAFHRLCEAAITADPFPLYGTGEQVRDFTYVADVVAANLLALEADVEPGLVVNVAGGGATSMNEAIDLVGKLAGRPVPVDRQPAQPGDVRRTGGSGELAGDLLGWKPAHSVEDGLARQFAWHRERHPA